MLLFLARGAQDDIAIEIMRSKDKKHRVALVPLCPGIDLTFMVCFIRELFIFFAEDQGSQLPV